MPVITAIKPQKKREEKFNIYLDGKFSFSIPAETLVKEGLLENQEISPEKVIALIKEGDFFLAYEKVLKLLSFRPRSEFEIEEYLLKKGVGEETRKLVLEKIKSLGLVDDDKFACWWVEQRSFSRPKGERQVRFELRRKGISREKTEAILKRERPRSTDLLLAEKEAQKKLARLGKLPQMEIKKKLYAFLLRQGFAYEVVEESVAKIFKKR